MRSKGVWLFPLLSCFPEEAKVCSNLMLLCLVLKLDDRDLGPRGRWPNYAKRVNGDKLGVLELKWEIGWNSLYLGFQSPGGGHYWDSMHFRNIWVLTFSWTEKGSGRKSKQHRAMSGLLVMVSVMDSEPGCDELAGGCQCCQPGIGTSLVIWSRTYLFPCQPGKALHGTMNMVPYTGCSLSSTISHISPGFPPLAQQPPLKPCCS